MHPYTFGHFIHTLTLHLVYSLIPNTLGLLLLNSVVNIWVLVNSKQKKTGPLHDKGGRVDYLIITLEQETQVS